MKKKVQMINIDGLNGIGQTTQVNLLYKHFKDLGIPTLVNKIEDNTESAIKILDKSKNFLSENENGIVINDGSIAEMIVIDMVGCTPTDTLLEKYKNVLDIYSHLSHNFKISNILLIPFDPQMCVKRLQKVGKKLDPLMGMEIVRGLQTFDNHIISRQLKFESILVRENWTMLSLHDKILKLLDK